MSTKSIPVSKLDLDLLNPRLLVAATTQVEALELMMSAEAKSIYGLARNIAVRGALNPTDPMIVVKDGTRYTVLEGNRRLCALRLLAKPQLAPDPADKKRFAQLAKKNPVAIPKVDAVVADDRESADGWIELKHTGLRDGEGTKTWGPHAQRTFQVRRGGSKTFVDALVDAVKGWFPEDEALLTDLTKVVHGNQLTNLERIIDTPEGRAHVGLRQNGDVIEGQFPPDTILPFLKMLLSSLATPLPEKSVPWSRVWGNKGQRETWLETRNDVNPPASERRDAFEFQAPAAGPARADGSEETKPATKPKPPSKAEAGPVNPFGQPTLNFDGFVVHSEYPAPIHVLVAEVKNLKIADFPNTIFDVLRTLVEKTIKSYSTLQGLDIQPKRGGFVQFSDCLSWLESHMATSDELKPHLRSIRQIISTPTNFVITADAYNAANHDHNVTYGDSSVREAWNSLHGIMKVLLRTGPGDD